MKQSFMALQLAWKQSTHWGLGAESFASCVPQQPLPLRNFVANSPAWAWACAQLLRIINSPLQTPPYSSPYPFPGDPPPAASARPMHSQEQCESMLCGVSLIREAEVPNWNSCASSAPHPHSKPEQLLRETCTEPWSAWGGILIVGASVYCLFSSVRYHPG